MSSRPEEQSPDTATRSGAPSGDARAGLLYAIAANVCWGLIVLYWPLLEPASAAEILAHRIVWSLVFVVLLLGATRRLASIRRLLRNRRALAALAGAALFQGVNWGTYIYAVTSEQVLQAALGYFIAPLLTVSLAVVVLRESLRPAQWIGVGLGGVAVAILTADYGQPPFLALTMGVCFAGYGFLRNRVACGAVEGLAVETAILTGPALGWIVWLGAQGTGTFPGGGAGHVVLLLGGGVLTMVPLLLFGAAASRLPLATLGLLQYLAPVIQWVIGVLVVGEPMPLTRFLGFAVVWVALAVLAADGWRRSSTRHAGDSVEA